MVSYVSRTEFRIATGDVTALISASFANPFVSDGRVTYTDGSVKVLAWK